MASISNLIGEEIISSDSERIKTTRLVGEGVIVGLYFSAQWCPPCAEFTPTLIDFYNANAKKLNFEIIFISSDKNEAKFEEYHSSMPWFALPYSERSKKARLSKKFKIQSIPALVLLDSITCEVITLDGRPRLQDDPCGNKFPWKPLPLLDILRGPVRCVTGDLDSDSNLKGKVKGFFFSAHWCPPCRVFTPVLIKLYNSLRQRAYNFEIVFISSDRTEQSFDDYFSTMPWLAIPFDDSRGKELTKHFNVKGIPALILVNENDDLITNDGRAVVAKDPEGKDFPWLPKPLAELNQLTMPEINCNTCLVFFTDGEEDAIIQAKECMKDNARKYKEKQKAEQNSINEIPDLIFLYEGASDESGELADTLWNLVNPEDLSPEDSPRLVLFDIPETRYSIFNRETIITAESIKTFVQNFEENKLEYSLLSTI